MKTWKIPLILIFLFVFRVVLAFNFWHPDVRNHMDWGTRFWSYGPDYFYDANVWNFTWPNQPPGTMYLMAGVRKVFEFIFSIFWGINLKISAFPSGIITYFESNLYPALLHLPAIIADFGIAYLIYLIFKNFLNKEKVGKIAAIAFLANPVIWYNSSFWGQYDSVINFFALIAFYLLMKRRLFWGVFFFAMSIYTKASLLIFAPIFFVILIRQNYKLTELLRTFLFLSFFFLIITLPFDRENPARWLYFLYKDKVFHQQLHLITANAFNLWSGVAGIYEKPEVLTLGPLQYRTWGIALFALAYIPSLVLVYKKQDIKSVVWSLAIAGASSFMLLTNMHERYLYPLFPYLTILVANGSVSWLIYLAISLTSLLNMYHLWFTPKFDVIISLLSFSDRLMPRILGFVNFGIFLYIYKKFIDFSKNRST